MHPSSTSWLRVFAHRLLVGAALLLAGCALLPTSPVTVSAPRLLAAYVVLGEDGAPWARAITPANPGVQVAACPDIAIDGSLQRMTVRAPAATPAQRATASNPATSKASSFPVLTCEFLLPRNAARIAIGSSVLPTPKAEPQRIMVIGDTGCRLKKADNAWQACLDKTEWPFLAVSEAAAAMTPDLVIHVGDYHYRENACPPEIAGCQGSPWGYGWDAWQVDFFDPAAKLLAAAPWVMARGNHEECRRAGQGWFRFLDFQAFDQARSCDDPKNDPFANFSTPYAIPIARDQQLIVFDSALAGSSTLNPAKPRDAHAFAQYRQNFLKIDELAARPGVASIFINHHPVLGYSYYDSAVQGGNRALLSVMNTQRPLAYFPPSVRLAIHGHVHLFEAINFSSNHPATILSGMGGDEVSNDLPDPFPINIGPAEGVTLENITHSSQFGFVVMDKRDSNWQISAYDYTGKLKTTCLLTGAKLHCDKTGLLK